MNLDEYLEEYYPSIVEEFARYSGLLPSIGDTIETLVSGYGGRSGVQRVVVEINNRDIVLGDPFDRDRERRYLCDKKEWWREIKVIG